MKGRINICGWFKSSRLNSGLFSELTQDSWWSRSTRHQVHTLRRGCSCWGSLVRLLTSALSMLPTVPGQLGSVRLYSKNTCRGSKSHLTKYSQKFLEALPNAANAAEQQICRTENTYSIFLQAGPSQLLKRPDRLRLRTFIPIWRPQKQ
jgi:hypothetical protein